MRKLVSIFLVLLMLGSIFLFAACGSSKSADGEEEEENESAEFQGEVNVYN